MPDPETRIRTSLALRLQRGRAESVKAWDDDHVAEVLAAFDASPVPSGVVTAGGPEAASALAALKERAEQMEALASEMLATFTKGSNGSSARVKQATVDEWQSRLGEQQ